MQEKTIHEIFQISILLKGAHAIVECVGGVIIAFVSVGAIRSVIDRITHDVAMADRRAFFATHLSHWAQGFSPQSKQFYAVYLLSHGVVKLFLVIGLLRGKLWAYPASLIAIGLFIVYQIYRYTYTHGIGLILLTVFDIFVIVLVWHEYRLAKRHISPT